MEDNVTNGEESENLLIIVLQAFEYHQLEALFHRRVSGLRKNMGAYGILRPVSRPQLSTPQGDRFTIRNTFCMRIIYRCRNYLHVFSIPPGNISQDYVYKRD
jgi:hypothetical protein